MTDIFKLEQALFNSWAALQVEMVEGWQLRYALGHTKRSNSASPLYSSRLDFAELAQIVKERYKAQNIKPMFRITPLAPEGLDAYLDQNGWKHFEPSYGMAFELPQKFKIEGDKEAVITLSDAPSLTWVEGAAKAYELQDWQKEALGAIVSNILRPSAYATVYKGKLPIGYGLAVYERGFVGLYDLAILAEHRGQGVGRRMVGSLIHWGKSKGAHTAYLQARQANVRAVGLYESLGFKKTYEYHHRVWG